MDLLDHYGLVELFRIAPEFALPARQEPQGREQAQHQAHQKDAHAGEREKAYHRRAEGLPVSVVGRNLLQKLTGLGFRIVRVQQTGRMRARNQREHRQTHRTRR